MSVPVLLLILLNFALIALLPKVFFRGDGRLNLRWWATAIPFAVAPVFLVAAYAVHVSAFVPRSWVPVLESVAVVLSVTSIGLLFLTVGTHRIPISLWHQDNDAPAQLVTYGAYRWIRHPFYASFIVALLAAFTAYPHWVTLGTLGYGYVVLNLTARREEKRLSVSAFGSQYRQYLGRTGRFLPRPGAN